MKLICGFFLGFLAACPVLAADATPAANAVNEVGLALARNLPSGNLCLSPYSIQCALAMTFDGADGITRDEMAKALHYPNQSEANDNAFATLTQSLEEAREKSNRRVEESKTLGGPSEPISLHVANRLFGKSGFPFAAPFLTTLRDHWHSPLEELDFARDHEAARAHINDWVKNETQERIRDLIPGGGITSSTRLVLVNAIYLKAPWEKPFEKSNTAPASFQIDGKTSKKVPTMYATERLGYAKEDGFTAISLPYTSGRLQFLILLPDQANGLASLEAKLTPKLLTDCAALPGKTIGVFLPKFKFEPPTISLVAQLKALGMSSAFTQGADFDRIAMHSGIYISDVFHKTFIALDESGTEAAAATAVVMDKMLSPVSERPTIVRVDHPFFYAIQDVATGACIFLGRVVDPG